MIINYIRLAFRSLWRQKGYSAVNILGLSASLCVAILMLLWVQDEWTTDKFHANKDRLFRLHRTVPHDGGRTVIHEGTPYPLLAAAQEEIPEVEKYIPYRESDDETVIYKNNQYRVKGTFANTAFFESFSFPILQGDVQELDRNLNAMAISESLANRLFGDTWRTSAIGEVLDIHDTGEFSVEAVFADLPENSTLNHDMVFSFNYYVSQNDWIKEWTNSGMQGVLLLNEHADPAVVGRRIEKLYKSKQEHTELKEGCRLSPYADNYLYGKYDDQGSVSGGRIEYVRTFALAAMLLLIISCINFVNLATALASRRAKEVGVRKVVGAQRHSLILQFMIEAGVITAAALFVAVGLAKLLEPTVGRIMGKTLNLDLTNPHMWMGLGIIGVITVFLSGCYPAFVLSAFRPVRVLKGRLHEWASHLSLRKALVVMQFVLALLLIAGAFVVREQVHFIMNKNLGVAKENILEIYRDENIAENYAALRNELLSSPAIEDVTSAGPSPLSMFASTSGVTWPGKRPDQENQEFSILWAENNFTDLFEVPMAEGEFYRKDEVLDSTMIVLNEKAVEIMGIEDPIGKSITWWGLERRIIGVVEDFHNRSLYSSISPTGILQDREGTWSVYVKTTDGMLTDAIDHLQATFAAVVPEVPLHYEFLDDKYEQEYTAELVTGKLSNYFAAIAILISILGLLGLATYMAQQRQKEIGVRKVLGASIADLLLLLSRDFVGLVLLAACIGLPIAWYSLSQWLTKFEYSVNLTWWMFAVPMIGGFAIAALTVGVQSLRAAWQHPVHAIQED